MEYRGLFLDNEVATTKTRVYATTTRITARYLQLYAVSFQAIPLFLGFILITAAHLCTYNIVRGALLSYAIRTYLAHFFSSRQSDTTVLYNLLTDRKVCNITIPREITLSRDSISIFYVCFTCVLRVLPMQNVD